MPSRLAERVDEQITEPLELNRALDAYTHAKSNHEAGQLVAIDQDQALGDTVDVSLCRRDELARGHEHALRCSVLDQRASKLADLTETYGVSWGVSLCLQVNDIQTERVFVDDTVDPSITCMILSAMVDGQQPRGRAAGPRGAQATVADVVVGTTGGSLCCRRRRIVMTYVQRVLQPGEQVRHVSSIHWIVYWLGVAVALLAVVAYWLSDTRYMPGVWRYTAYALALVAAVLLIRQWFEWWITEIAVTNRRVIYKKGLIQRETNEMNMDKVESVQIDQSILGRMLDYGDVTILGTGEGFKTLRTIARPIELRNSITGNDAQA
jgi:membrane protein YdbS with pleckstrin-like domain